MNIRGVWSILMKWNNEGKLAIDCSLPSNTEHGLVEDIEPAPLKPCFIHLKHHNSINEADTMLHFFQKSFDNKSIRELNGLYAYAIFETHQEQSPSQFYILMQSTFFEHGRLQSRHGALSLYSKHLNKDISYSSLTPQLGGELYFEQGKLSWWNAQSSSYSVDTAFDHRNYLEQLEKNNLRAAHTLLSAISDNIKNVLLPPEQFTLYPYDVQKPFIKQELSLLTNTLEHLAPISLSRSKQNSLEELKPISPNSVAQIEEHGCGKENNATIPFKNRLEAIKNKEHLMIEEELEHKNTI